MGQLVWQLSTNKESLWVRWVHGIFIKEDSSIWEHKAPVYSSWYWRKLNAVKLLMKDWYVQDRYRLTQDGSYSISRSYMELIGHKPKLRIAEHIWTSIALPKHRFILWLAVQGRLRLLTQERKLRLKSVAQVLHRCWSQECIYLKCVHGLKMYGQNLVTGQVSNFNIQELKKFCNVYKGSIGRGFRRRSWLLSVVQ